MRTHSRTAVRSARQPDLESGFEVQGRVGGDPPYAGLRARGSVRTVPCFALSHHVAALPERLSRVPRTLPPAGRLLALTRVGIWVLFVLAAANGLFLYFVPGRADTDYAWAIKPGVNAAFIGAGFLAGTLATGLVLAYATRWRTFSTLPIALWVLATSLFTATLIHNDRFKFDYPPTWVWTFVYAAVPFAVPYLVLRQRRNADPEPEASAKLTALRVISGVFGAAILAGAIALFVAPVDLGEHWLWALTP